MFKNEVEMILAKVLVSGITTATIDNLVLTDEDLSQALDNLDDFITDCEKREFFASIA